jgi:hypothetical protein
LVVGLVIAAMKYSWPGRWERGGCFAYLSSLAVSAEKLMLGW